MEELEKVKEKLYLVARTEDLSPPIIALVAGVLGTAVVGSIVSRITDWAIDSIRSRIADRRERSELWLNLFWTCRNAEFFIGRIGQGEDLRAAEELIKNAVGIFGTKPERGEEEGIELKLERNLVSIGGPKSNEFSRIFMERYPYLPYRFNFEEFPWTIIDSETQADAYIPEVYPKDDGFSYTKDYGMLIKASHIDSRAKRMGRKVIIVAGTHSLGTRGVATGIREIPILQEIWDKTKGRDFQAIFGVDIEGGDVRNTELIEIWCL